MRLPPSVAELEIQTRLPLSCPSFPLFVSLPPRNSKPRLQAPAGSDGFLSSTSAIGSLEARRPSPAWPRVSRSLLLFPLPLSRVLLPVLLSRAHEKIGELRTAYGWRDLRIFLTVQVSSISTESFCDVFWRSPRRRRHPTLPRPVSNMCAESFPGTPPTQRMLSFCSCYLRTAGTTGGAWKSD